VKSTQTDAPFQKLMCHRREKILIQDIQLPLLALRREGQISYQDP